VITPRGRQSSGSAVTSDTTLPLQKLWPRVKEVCGSEVGLANPHRRPNHSGLVLLLPDTGSAPVSPQLALTSSYSSRGSFAQLNRRAR
jgi:hypothetical protein